MDKTQFSAATEKAPPPKSMLSLKKMLTLDTTLLSSSSPDKLNTTKNRSRSADAASIGVKNVRFSTPGVQVRESMRFGN